MEGTCFGADLHGGTDKRNMTDAVIHDIVALLPPLLQSLEALGLVARHLNPPEFGAVMHQIGMPEQPLHATLAPHADWPGQFAHLRGPLQSATEATVPHYLHESRLARVDAAYSHPTSNRTLSAGFAAGGRLMLPACNSALASSAGTGRLKYDPCAKRQPALSRNAS